MPQYSLINHFENVSKLEVENKLFKRYRNSMKQARIPFNYTGIITGNLIHL